MAHDQKEDKSEEEEPSENIDEGLPDFVSTDEPADPEKEAFQLRPDVVDRIFGTLSADAQRGDGQLRRGDINRIYLRKQLSVAECVSVEERLITAGYRITDEEDHTDDANIANSERGLSRRYLNETEEKELGRRIQLALRLPNNMGNLDPAYVDRIRTDAARAKEIFVETNIRYVEQLARRRGHHQHLTLEDVMQEGVIGLLRACEMYDPERGFRFKTYATWWIEQYMRRAIADQDRTIRVPVHLHEKLVRIRRSATKLTMTTGRSPSLYELASAVGIESEKLLKLLWLIQTTNCAEGDAPIGDDATLLSVIADSGETPFDIYLLQELKERLDEVLATLTPREEHILRMRFGFFLEDEYTLERLGQQYNLTRERIRQIEWKALRKLQHINRKSLLAGFLDSES